MPYENVIMGLMLFVSFVMFLLFVYVGITASKDRDVVIALIGFLASIGALVTALPSLEYFGIVQLGILH